MSRDKNAPEPQKHAAQHQAPADAAAKDELIAKNLLGKPVSGIETALAKTLSVITFASSAATAVAGVTILAKPELMNKFLASRIGVDATRSIVNKTKATMLLTGSAINAAFAKSYWDSASGASRTRDFLAKGGLNMAGTAESLGEPVSGWKTAAAKIGAGLTLIGGTVQTTIGAVALARGHGLQTRLASGLISLGLGKSIWDSASSSTRTRNYLKLHEQVSGKAQGASI